MPLPNFLLVGAAKSGTSALYRYLAQHPEIFTSPVKEPAFFAFEGGISNCSGPRDYERAKYFVTNYHEYKALFEKASPEKAIGEASTAYLYVREAAARIKHYLPGVKIVIILRNPVDRAFSNYLNLVRDGYETVASFEDALKSEKDRIKSGWFIRWHYQNRGFYSKQLQHYFELFERRAIKIFLYDDFQSDPKTLMRDLFRFLQVDEGFIPDMTRRYNENIVITNKVLRNIVHGVYKFRSTIFQDKSKEIISWKVLNYFKKLRLAKKPPLLAKTKKRLIADYEEDIRKVEKLIGRDLSVWRT